MALFHHTLWQRTRPLIVLAAIASLTAACTPDQMNTAAQMISSTVTTMPQGQVATQPTSSNPNYGYGTGRLSLNKTSYRVGETIYVTFQASSGMHRSAWIGILPSNIPHGDESVNDQYDITYQYLEGRTSGSLSFVAPKAGAWDMRMHDNDSAGHEIGSVSFVVR